jgi:hypothetical protein
MKHVSINVLEKKTTPAAPTDFFVHKGILEKCAIQSNIENICHKCKLYNI